MVYLLNSPRISRIGVWVIPATSVLLLAVQAFGASGFAPVPETERSPVAVQFTESASVVDISISLPSSFEIAPETDIPGEGVTNRLGYPILPAIGRWVRVPERGALELSYREANPQRFAGSTPDYCKSGEDGLVAESPVNLHGIWPEQPVVMGEPMIMRGVRVAPLTYYPLRWDAARGEYLRSNVVDIEIRVVGGAGSNEIQPLPHPASRGFDKMIDRLLLNPPHRDQNEDYLPGSCLLVCDDDLVDVVEEFAAGKRSAGHTVEILPIEEPENLGVVGIKAAISDIYNETGFEFLIIFGSDDAEAPLFFPFDNQFYDVFYAQLEGDDMLPDVAVGTFNCETEDNLICAIHRSLSYQYDPYFEDTDWFTRAGVGVGACSVPQDLSPSYTGKWIAEVLQRYGFDDISTSYFADNRVDDPSRMVEGLYNDGTNFILVRAHEWDLEVDDIEATGIHPFHFLVSSGTISGRNNGAFNWAFRQGTPDDIKGPSAGFGHQSSPRTNVANALAGGLIESMFLFDIGSYGWARNYTVANLARVMVADGVQLMPYYYSHWRYYGDPEQGVWLGVPDEVEVEAPGSIDPEATYLSAAVRLDEQLVPGAVVTLHQDDGLDLMTTTGDGELARFVWERGELNESDLILTVTGDEIRPRQIAIPVDAEPVIALVDWHIDDEENGNGDGIPNPGEEPSLIVTLENLTDNDWEGECQAGGSDWLDFGDGDVRLRIPANEQVETIWDFWVHPGCPDGFTAKVDVNGSDGEVSFAVGTSFEIESPHLWIVDLGMEGDPEPGGGVSLDLVLGNIGSIASPPVNVQLVSHSAFALTEQDQGSIDALEINREGSLRGEPLRLGFSAETVPGSSGRFSLILNSDMWEIAELPFSITVGAPGAGDPLGPDSYGYIALNDGDDDIEWADAPEYDWLDINTWHGEVEGVSLDIGFIQPDEDEADQTALVDLPFAFRYYGEEFDQISVCSNGWIAAGNQTSLVNQQNWLLPGFDGAFGMMAVFWDRMHYDGEEDGVFVFNDLENFRFIIQWEGWVEDEDSDPGRNVFQAILHDPEEYPTATGDSRILYQYNTVNNVQNTWEANAHASVGISSPDGLDGLTYTYWNEYSPACAELADGRAILWTTIRYGPVHGRVQGRVTRYIDSTEVADAIVRTSNDRETLSGQDGSYRIWNVEPGIFDITATAERYGEAVAEDVELEEDGVLELDLVLPHGWVKTVLDTIFIDPQNNEATSLEVANSGNLNASIDRIELIPIIWPEVEWDAVIWPQGLEIAPDDTAVTVFEGLMFEAPWESLPVGVYTGQIIFHCDTPQDSIVLPLILNVPNEYNDPDNRLPLTYKLEEPYPNPFNSQTTLRFGLPGRSQVSLVIYDLTGRQIAVALNGRQDAGWHRLTWDASGLPTGLYLLRMTADDFSAARRLLLLR